MNKKTNTVLFMFGATVFNVVAMIVIFVVLFLLYGRFLASVISPEVGQVIIIVLFIGSIALTYFIYHRLIRWISSKWNLDDYFDPIFSRRKK